MKSLTGIIGTDPTSYTFTTVVNFINSLQTLLLIIVAGYAIVGLFMAAFDYFTAFGSESKAEKAKETIKWVIIGIIIVTVSQLILYLLKLIIGAPQVGSTPTAP